MREWIGLAAAITTIFGLALYEDQQAGKVDVPPEATAKAEPTAAPAKDDDDPRTWRSGRPLGTVATVNGKPQRLIEQWKSNGRWYYRFVPVESPRRRAIQTGYYDGRSQWTYPGDIASHLMGGNHGVSRPRLAGMSKREMESLHDALHNGTKRRLVTPQVRNNCPGGYCPR